MHLSTVMNSGDYTFPHSFDKKIKPTNANKHLRVSYYYTLNLVNLLYAHVLATCWFFFYIELF